MVEPPFPPGRGGGGRGGGGRGGGGRGGGPPGVPGGAPGGISEHSLRLREIKRRRRRAALRRGAVLVLVVGVALAAVWLYRERPWRAATEPTPPVASQTPAERRPGPAAPARPAPDTEATQEPASDVAAAPAETLPSLDESDALVRRAVAEITARDDVAAWLVGGDLVRRFVVVVDNVAEGRNPRRHLRELSPRGGFDATAADGALWLEPESYERYDAFAGAFASVDAAGAARLYRRLTPLVDEAYRDLGYPDADFDARLREAFVELLSVPVVQGDIELVRRGGKGFAFADPTLEDLSPPQKQLLRMGPANMRRVQGKLREIARALGIEPAALPEASVYRSSRS